MIVGNPPIFAIESEIATAYDHPGSMALGFFLLHVSGLRYGVQSPNATLLACSFDGVKRRIGQRGVHCVPFAQQSAAEIAFAYRSVLYADEQLGSYFGHSPTEFSELIRASKITWAPDGDEAFDDGSYILQFDVGENVRLIAFKSLPGSLLYDATTLRDQWLEADEFYGLLRKWHDSFFALWGSMPHHPM